MECLKCIKSIKNKELIEEEVPEKIKKKETMKTRKTKNKHVIEKKIDSPKKIEP